MKRYIVLAMVVLVASSASLRSQGLDDQYFSIFNLIQEADSLSVSAPAKAVGKYVQAQSALQRFQKGNPDYSPQVVSFRLSYIAQRLAELSSGATPSATAVPGPAEQRPPAAAPGRSVDSETNAPGDLQWQVNALKEQVKQMLADRSLLQAKLKEALAAQPAQSDPRELARAEERIRALQKETELLKAGIEGQKSKVATLDPNASEQAQAALSAANQQLTQLKVFNDTATTEKEALQARVKASPDLAALQAENELLKKQVLAANTAAQPQSAPPAADTARIRLLERERDELLKKLEAANKAASGKKSKTSGGKQVQDLEVQLSAARARLEVLEARQVPYTAEELAWLKQPQASLAQPQAIRKSELGPDATKLLGEAQSFFASRQFDKAEAAYSELLKHDPRNVLCLANLAAIQSESGKLDAAEANAKAALAERPEDAFSLYIMGMVKFRQGKFDDSLDALSRAAKIDPQAAQVQNYLGLALNEKGMRGPAETALRKAIQLQPNYAEAHYNLAVAYVSQQPPAVEMARFHYQKALALGQPRNADMEKRFESK